MKFPVPVRIVRVVVYSLLSLMDYECTNLQIFGSVHCLLHAYIHTGGGEIKGSTCYR